MLARKARQAARCGDPGVARETWRIVLDAFVRDLDLHFSLEEKALLPALLEIGEHALVARALGEHDSLRACIRDDAPDAAPKLARFARLLHDHIRFEERVLFDVAQVKLRPEALEAVLAAMGPSRDCA